MDYISKYSNRVAIETYSKYSGHGEIKQGFNFEKLFKDAVKAKDDIIRQELDDEAIDITLYIGVHTNDRFAIVYATRTYYNLMKGQIDDHYGKQFVQALDDFIANGSKPKVYEYSKQTELGL